MAGDQRAVLDREEIVEQHIADAIRLLRDHSVSRDEHAAASRRLIDLERERDEALPSRRYWTGLSSRRR